MSINVSVGFQIPTNVVEVGDEISTQQLGAITSGSSPTSANPFTTVSYISGLSYLTTSSASTTYAPKASPTFTGVVTIPAGASISGYLTTSSASSTYQTQAGMSSYLTTSTASSTYQTQAGMSSYLTITSASSTYQPLGSYLVDAPSNGSEYVRKNAAWSVATGGGGGLTISTLSNSATSTLNATAPTTGQSLTFDGTDLKWATVSGGGGVAWGGITGTVTNQTDLVNYINGLGYLTVIPNPTAGPRSGGPYTLLSSDWNNCIVFTAGGTLNIPQNYVLATPIGTQIYVCNMNSSTNIVGLTDSTETTVIYGTTSSISVGLHILIKTDTNEWFIS